MLGFLVFVTTMVSKFHLAIVHGSCVLSSIYIVQYVTLDSSCGESQRSRLLQHAASALTSCRISSDIMQHQL